VRTWRLALATAVLLGACALPWSRARPTICYPPPPVVSPDRVAPGAVVVAATAGYGDPNLGGGSCGPTKRLAVYVVQMFTERERAAHKDGSETNRLGAVRVAARSLAFRTMVTIPPATRPGRYFVGYARAPGDHYHAHCLDNAACAGPASPDLTVVPRQQLGLDAR
jgi:hypothetical protein